MGAGKVIRLPQGGITFIACHQPDLRIAPNNWRYQVSLPIPPHHRNMKEGEALGFKPEVRSGGNNFHTFPTTSSISIAPSWTSKMTLWKLIMTAKRVFRPRSEFETFQLWLQPVGLLYEADVLHLLSLCVACLRVQSNWTMVSVISFNFKWSIW